MEKYQNIRVENEEIKQKENTEIPLTKYPDMTKEASTIPQSPEKLDSLENPTVETEEEGAGGKVSFKDRILNSLGISEAEKAKKLEKKRTEALGIIMAHPMKKDVYLAFNDYKKEKYIEAIMDNKFAKSYKWDEEKQKFVNSAILGNGAEGAGA